MNKRICAMEVVRLLVSSICAVLLAASGSAAGPEGAHGYLGAGFRYSAYGPGYDPGPRYWAGVGKEMAARFDRATPEAICVIGVLDGDGCKLGFPGNGEDPLIRFSADDANEEALQLFDQLGFRVWLQVEPGNASVETLFHLVLNRYGRHASVVGVGVDVEWYRSTEKADGQAVTDAEAASWLAAARSHNPALRLFLKHWQIRKMPPTVRDGLLFIDDSQTFPSMEAIIDEFALWGEAFAPAPVGFQYGYVSDRSWWEKLADPPGLIGRGILARVPNTEGLYWVDFTVLEVFPPREDERRRDAGPAAEKSLRAPADALK
ncbi:MAG: hypothetical protein AB1714_30065 [Acidobacteriota bacterium]